jgi:hypothetical protein
MSARRFETDGFTNVGSLLHKKIALKYRWHKRVFPGELFRRDEDQVTDNNGRVGGKRCVLLKLIPPTYLTQIYTWKR